MIKYLSPYVWRRVSALVACCSVVCTQPAVVRAETIDDETVYYSTSQFEVTEFDRRMYLRGAPDASEEHVGSRIRNLQALSDLYAMEILMSDASDLSLLPKAERDWIANYAVAIETLKRYVQLEVDRRLEETDWDTEAMEVYRANSEQYRLGESVSVRTLLIRNDGRSEEEALRLAQDLLIQARQPDTDFEELVRAKTEDDVARATGGLMEYVGRGQTVEPFEEAAFALREEGGFSEPVVSQFGVHLIQFLGYQPPRLQAFDEVKERILAELRPKRAAQYRDGIQSEARERMPDGFIEHTQALDDLLQQTSDGKLGPD